MASASPATHKDYSKRELAAVIAAVCVGEGGLITMPYILGGVADRFSVSAGVSGLVSTAQFASMAIVSLILALSIHKVDRRKLVLGAVPIALIGHIMAVIFSSWSLIIVSRIMVGIGEAILLTAGTAAAAATPRPQRTFSIITFAFVALGGAIYLIMPSLTERVGHMAVFYVLVVVVLLGLPFLFAMPRLRDADVRHDSAPANVWRPFPWVLVGIACLYMGGNSLWAFSERIGVAMGLEARAIGIAFLAGVLLTSLGPIAANFAQQRWGYRKSIVVGIAVNCVACVALGGAFHYAVFFLGFVFMNVSAFYLLPMYRALTAHIDPAGRVAPASIVVQAGATAIGPFLASVALLAGGSYPGVGLYAGGLSILSLIFVIRTARRGDSDARKSLHSRGSS